MKSILLSFLISLLFLYSRGQDQLRIVESMLIKVEHLDSLLYRGANTGDTVAFKSDLRFLDNQMKKIKPAVYMHAADFYDRVTKIQNVLCMAFKNLDTPGNALFITTTQHEIMLYQNELLNYKGELLAEEAKKEYDAQIAVLRDSLNIKTLLIVNLVKECNDKDQKILNWLEQHAVTGNTYNSVFNRPATKTVTNAQTENVTTKMVADKKCCCDTFRISKSHYISINGFENSLYSISYFQGIKDGKDYKIALGAEFIIPSNNSYATSEGGFILPAVLNRNILFYAGAGFLSLRSQAVNISWKSGLIYFISKFGFGISYSPLTKFGAGVAFNF